MAALAATLPRMTFGHLLAEADDAPVVTRERHARALRTARDELAAFAAALHEQVPMELAATHLRAAAGALEDLIGAVTVDDVLDRVFGDFCVGK
jgi:tRNA modification GTPase